MKHFLAALSLLLALSITAVAQVPQGTSMRATNGIGFGVTTIANRLLATNTSGTNHFAGTLNVRSNISSQSIFYGDGSGLTNIGGAFTNLPFQDLSMSLNTFGDSIVSGEAGPPGWVAIMKTNLNDVTEIINFGGSGYQQHNITTAFLASGGHTNEPYFMEVAYNGYTADPVVDGSNRLYFIRVAVSNTPSPKRFLLLQMPNDQSSSNTTARHEFTTNLNATIESLYPDNYYAWWDWFKLQGDGSAQDNIDLARDVPPSSLMNADGIHPNSLGNYRIGTNMAGIWRNYLRSYQEPLLTGDLPLLARSLTNATWNFKNLVLGSPDLYEITTGEADTGNLRMGNTNGAITWLGAKLHGGLQWFSPGVYSTVIKVDPDTGYLNIGHASLVTPIVDAIFDPFGGLTVRTNLAVPDIQLGLYTAAVPHSIYSISYGSDVAAAQIATYSDTAAIVPRTIWTTSESGSPGVSRVIITNANLVIAPASTVYGNASGVSNAVTLIAGGCMSITTNADGRTFTLSISGSGADVLTNSRAAATLEGLTLTGITTNGATGGSNWIGGISLWNPATGQTINLTNGIVKTTGLIQSTNTATANTALTLNGAATGAAAAVISFDTNNVNKFKVDNAGKLTVASGIAWGSADITGPSGGAWIAGSRGSIDWTGSGLLRVVPIGGATGVNLSGVSNAVFNGEITVTNGVIWQSGQQLTNIYTAVATLDFGNVATIGCADLTMTVTGAALGDVVDLGVPNASVVANSSYSAWVSAADTVTVRFCALISGDPASGVFRAEVHKWK